MWNTTQVYEEQALRDIPPYPLEIKVRPRREKIVKDKEGELIGFMRKKITN
jgi:hypothetical protein